MHNFIGISLHTKYSLNYGYELQYKHKIRDLNFKILKKRVIFVSEKTINIANIPLVIEAAVTPLRKGKPVQSAEIMIEESKACIEAGAFIIHHHHDFRHSKEDAIKEISDVGKGILETYPHAYIYANYMQSDDLWGKYAYLQPMAEEKTLRMIALDPGLTQFGNLGEDNLPSIHLQGGTTYPEAAAIVEFANKHNIPLMIGIYDPSNLRWAVAYERAGKLPAGTMIKLYFGGRYSMGGTKTPAVNFGLYPTKEALDIYVSMLKGTDLPWMVSVQGDAISQTPLLRYAIETGGHVRVGIEDTGGATEMTNRETVEEAVQIAQEVGRPVIQGKEAFEFLTRKK